MAIVLWVVLVDPSGLLVRNPWRVRREFIALSHRPNGRRRPICHLLVGSPGSSHELLTAEGKNNGSVPHSEALLCKAQDWCRRTSPFDGDTRPRESTSRGRSLDWASQD